MQRKVVTRVHARFGHIALIRRIGMRLLAMIGRFDLACEAVAVKHHVISEGYDYAELQQIKAAYDARRAARMGGQP